MALKGGPDWSYVRYLNCCALGANHTASDKSQHNITASVILCLKCTIFSQYIFTQSTFPMNIRQIVVVTLYNAAYLFCQQQKLSKQNSSSARSAVYGFNVTRALWTPIKPLMPSAANPSRGCAAVSLGCSLHHSGRKNGDVANNSLIECNTV